MRYVGLIDCNNFFVSCEKVFAPALADRPVVVTSNNDGCVVAMSGEAKALGITRGVPVFQIRELVERHKVAVLHGNHRLYGNLSARVMATVESILPDMLLILGDRYEMLAVATAATIMRIPIVHIAGGEISEGAFDDCIRHAITKLSSLHLTATEPYRQRVISMGENESMVINTGAIGVWNMANETPMSKTELEHSIDMEITPETLLVTLHPATLDTEPVASRHQSITCGP